MSDLRTGPEILQGLITSAHVGELSELSRAHAAARQKERELAAKHQNPGAVLGIADLSNAIELDAERQVGIDDALVIRPTPLTPPTAKKGAAKFKFPTPGALPPKLPEEDPNV